MEDVFLKMCKIVEKTEVGEIAGHLNFCQLFLSRSHEEAPTAGGGRDEEEGVGLGAEERTGVTEGQRGHV